MTTSDEDREALIEAAAKTRDPKAAQAACEHHILVAGDLAVFEYAKRNRDLKTAAPNHSPKFEIDEASLAVGARAMTALALDYLGQP